MALSDVVYNKTVDVAQSMPVPVVFAKQNENGKRKVIVTLLKDGQPFVIGTGISGYIQGATAQNPVTKQPIRFKRMLTSLDTTANTATFVITESMTAEIGITQCEIALYDTTKPNEIVCTANINIEVQGTGMSPQDEMASDDYQAIVSIKAEVTAMRDEVRTKTNQAIAAQGAAETAAQNAYNSALGVQKIVAGNEAYTKQETDLKYSIAPRKVQASTTGELKLTDADYGLSYLELQGNSEQYTNTANINMLDVEYNKSLGLHGTDKFLRTTGEIDVSGNWSYSYYIKVTPNTLYSFVGIPASPAAAFVFYTEDKTYISGISTKDAVIDLVRAVTTPSNCEWMRISYVYTTNNPQMYLGELPLQGVYGAVDTPSPDYPSEVKSVGDIPKDINGVEIRNLFNNDAVFTDRTSFGYVELGDFTDSIRYAMYKMPDNPNSGLYVRLSTDITKWAIDAVEVQIIENSKWNLTIGTQYSYKPPSGTKLYLKIAFSDASSIRMPTNEELKSLFDSMLFMVTPAITIDEYRPYIGENNGLVKIESQGKNWFEGKGIVVGNINASGAPSYNAKVLRTDFIELDSNKQYVFNPGTYTPYIYLYDLNKTFIRPVNGVSKFNSENANYVILQFNSNPPVEQTQADIDNMNKTLQLEEGTQTTEYQPYYNQITWIPLREPLRGIRKPGYNYLDKLDKDGNVTQEVNSEVFPKGIVWSEQLGIAWSTPKRSIPSDTTSDKLLSEISQGLAVGGSYLNDSYVRQTLGKTLQEMNDFSANNSFIVYYVQKTPIKYQIPVVYVETYDQETNVRCLNKIKPSSMGLDYKIAISSLIKRLEALETTAVTEVNKNV